jgi:hypothetical protein
VIVPTKPHFENASEQQYPSFDRSSPTLAVFSVGPSSPQQILQVTTKKLILSTQKGQKVAEVEIPEGVVRVGKEYLAKN